jgi:hypothetical protein
MDGTRAAIDALTARLSAAELRVEDVEKDNRDLRRRVAALVDRLGESAGCCYPMLLRTAVSPADRGWA